MTRFWQKLRAVGVLMALSMAVSAHEADALRIEAGIELMPSFMAADLDIAEKPGEDGQLLLLLVYHEHGDQANRLARSLGEISVRKIPLRLETVQVEALPDVDQAVAGVFVAEHLSRSRLQAVIEFGEQQGALVFSPHEGDVEDGAGGGIHVSDRILPYVNESALEASGIRLKSFFLRIAERYGQ